MNTNSAMNIIRSPKSTSLRIRVVVGVVSGVGLLFTGMLFLGALFSHSRLLGTAAMIALALGLTCIAVFRGWQACLFFQTGGRSGLHGQQASRRDPPVQRTAWVVLQGLFAAIYAMAAGLIIWIACFSGH
jgi:hypothetical protein